jgi:hypothetical protein
VSSTRPGAGELHRGGQVRGQGRAGAGAGAVAPARARSAPAMEEIGVGGWGRR